MQTLTSGPEAPLTSPVSLLINLLSSRPDWSLLQEPENRTLIRENASREGVAPLIAFLSRDHVDTEGRTWCDGVLTRSWQRHDSALQQLGAIVKGFDRAGIRCLALKGPLLARRQYAPAFLRKPSGDLDLAIRPEDMARAATALEAAGYQSALTLKEAQAVGHHLVFRHASKLPVEIHFRLSHGILGLPVSGIFERAVECPLPGGLVALVMEPADELMHLVLHLVNDRFSTLFHSWEVKRVWENASPDVRQRAVSEIVAGHFAGVFALGDIAVRTLWGVSLLPPGLHLPKTWLQWRVNESLFHAMAATAGKGMEQPLGLRLRGRWLDLQTTDRPLDALRRAASLARLAAGQVYRRNWHTGRIPA